MQRLLKLILWIALFILLAAVAAYSIARWRLQELDQAAREQLGGQYLETTHGTLSYTRQGPGNAPVVILVHGFSTPKFVWEQVTPTVLAAGYQVITFDHLGRGFSDRPAGPYDSALYQSELAGLIEGLDLSTPLSLVGYSMGGANVVDYAASYPEQIKQLVLLAPAGYMLNAESAAPLAAPVIGEWLATVFGRQYAYKGIEAEVSRGLAPADMLDKFEQQAAFKGYTDALLSTIRHYPMADMAHRYRIVAQAGIPVAAIWGTADKIVPYSGAALMAKDVPQLKLTTLEGANHNMTYGEAGKVGAALVTALSD
jgi:pimeloyl-ACP methyl ester carboxylesterase